MALIKCPDCGKMVSERVDICPFCGCPKEYMLQQLIQKQAATKETEKTIDSSLPEKKIEEVMFVLGIKDIKYPKKLAPFAEMFGDYRKMADDALQEALNEYDNAGSLDNAIKTLKNFANKKVNEVVTQCVKILYENNVFITNDEFLNKYRISYEDYLEPVKEQYGDVVQMKQDLQSYRSAEIASRGRWQGGGFGLKGAIKGAVTAGALNMGSDFLHSFGDASQARKDNQAVQNSFNTIYKNSKWQICGGIYHCIIEIYNGLIKELKRINYFEEVLDFDQNKEKSLYETTMQNAKNDKEKLEKLVTCLKLFPGDRKVTDAMIPLLASFSNDNLGEWLRFWHLDYRYPDYAEQRKMGIEFDNFLVEKGMEKFNLRDCNVEPYLQLRQWIYEYYDKFDVDSMPKYSFFAKSIKEYYLQIHGAMTWYQIIEWVPLECDIYEFMTYMRREREGLINSVLPDFWLYGDSELMIPEKLRAMVLNDAAKILMFYDNSLLENGGKGIMVTTKYIYDLKKRLKLNLSEIDRIKCFDNGSIEIAIGNQVVEFKDSILNDEDGMNHLVKLIRVICVRYAGNDKLWLEKMSTPKPKGKILDMGLPREELQIQTECADIDNKNDIDLESGQSKADIGSDLDSYILQNFSSDTKMDAIKYYRDQTGLGLKESKEKVEELFAQGVVESKKEIVLVSATIFCTSCGKKIERAAKFCNFCGIKNTYKG